RVRHRMGARRGNPKTDSPYAGKPWLRHYDYWVPEDCSFPRQSVYQILNLAATYFHDRPATAFLDAQLTFADLKHQADRLAAGLARLRISNGHRVRVMLPNCPQYLISFFAIVRLGAIVTNVNPIYTPREVELVVKDSGMRALITLDVLAEPIEGIRSSTEIEYVIITSLQEYGANSPGPPAPRAGTLLMSTLIASANAISLPRVEINVEEDPAALVYTGGTTGGSKGASPPHYN